MSLSASSQSALDRGIAGVGPPPLFRVAHRWSRGQTEVTACIDVPVSVVIRVAPGIAPFGAVGSRPLSAMRNLFCVGMPTKPREDHTCA